MNQPMLGDWPDEPPKAHRLPAVIRSLAQHSERIIWGDHAFERIELRDINTTVALRVLKTGDIDGPIRPGNDRGEWIVKMIGPTSHERGARNVGVVTAVLGTETLFVMSVEWEDRR
jgi:hypothetical protein